MSWKIPTLADCNPGIEPTEYRVLVALAEKEAVTTGGIIIPTELKDKEDWRANTARLVAVSPLAFGYEKWPEGSRIPQVGDAVFVGRFPGEQIDGADGRTYRLCSDREVAAVLERAQQPQEKAA